MATNGNEMFDLIIGSIHPHDRQAVALHGGMRLKSAFQPIYSLSHRRVVGYEGLLRVHAGDGKPVPPYHLFGSMQAEADIVHLDRLSRALHLRNFCDQHDGSSWLFLNVNPRVIVQGKFYGSFFEDLLKHHSMPPARVVVEIIEGEIDDEAKLSESVQFYKDLGCLVAIDDFGAGHSNFERIWRLAPDIVKLDRSMIVQAADKATPRRVLPGIVSLIHEAGSLVLIEGVETAEEAMVAMDTDVDLVQGYYFAEPAPNLLQDPHSEQISELFQRYRDATPDDMRQQRLSVYRAAFMAAVEKLRQGATVEQACTPLLGFVGADRCYLLNQLGVQIGASLVSFSHAGAGDARYLPLSEASGANWFRRPYLRRALQHPNELQVTRPYLSIATGQLCVTLSMALTMFNQTQVLCYDVDWDES